MRIHKLGVLLILAAACGDNNTTNHPDLSMPLGDDLSVAAADLSAADFSVNHDMVVVNPPSQIETVRQAAKASGSNPDGGVLSMSLAVDDVFVTYLRPEVTGEVDDPPGFFVQVDPTGPGLFVRITPSTLTPAPQVGDQVRFVVTSAGTNSGGVPQATAITTWSVVSSGHSLTAITQNLSTAADLVSQLDSYDSELSTVSGTLSGAFANAGAGYTQASLVTAGIPTGKFPKLRVPVTLRDALDLTNGCVVTAGPTPMWKFTTTGEVSAWVAGDVNITSCPAPQVLSAIAPDTTHVVLTFDRIIKPASLLANGSQFTFNGGLTVDNTSGTAATLTAPTKVTVVTSAQTSATAYVVTVAASLTDTRNTGVDAAHNTATFSGFTGPAKLIINELNANISNGLDLVELKVVSGGSVAGFKLYQDFTVAKRVALTDLPSNLVVATGEFIVVHLNVPAVQPTMPIITEFNVGNVSATPKLDCTSPSCFAAWDVAATTSNSLAMTRRLISIVGADNVVQDAVAYSKQTGGANGNGVEIQAAIDASLWVGPCGLATPVSCGDGTMVSAAPFDSIAYNVATPLLGTGIADSSAQRKNATQPSSAATDWQTKASTWGADN